MEHAFVMLVGFLFGFATKAIWSMISNRKTDGDLRIDRSDSDGPYLFLELSNAIDVVSRKKRVIFNVINKDFLSRK